MRSLIAWLKLGYRGRQALKDTERRVKMGFDWKKNVAKGFISFIKTSAGIALPALLAFWSDPEAVKQLLAEVDLVKWAPFVTAALTMLFNWSKNKGK